MFNPVIGIILLYKIGSEQEPQKKYKQAQQFSYFFYKKGYELILILFVVSLQSHVRKLNYPQKNYINNSPCIYIHKFLFKFLVKKLLDIVTCLMACFTDTLLCKK